jgi:hypothetical protein
LALGQNNVLEWSYMSTRGILLQWICSYTNCVVVQNRYNNYFIKNKSVFRLLTDFFCLYNYEFWLSLCKIVQSSVILLLPLLDTVKNSWFGVKQQPTWYVTNIAILSLNSWNCHSIYKYCNLLKVYRLSELNLFVYIESCKYSMFYTNKMFWTRNQV